jgi:hypothetical protein
MIIPGTNALGFAVFLLGFGAVIGVQKIFGDPGEGPLLLLGGALVSTMGAVLERARNGDPQDPHPVGPRILLLPAWVMGGFWILLGAYKWIWP